MFPELKSIERRRRTLGMTQKQLALSCQISQSLVAKIERGLLVPSYEIARRIFTFLESAELKDEKLAKDVMHRGVVVLHPDDKVAKAASVLKKHLISQCPVVDGKVLAGGITSKDIMDAPRRAAIDDFISEPFPTVSGETPASIVKDLLKHHSAVLVLKKSAIEGIITAEDFL